VVHQSILRIPKDNVGYKLLVRLQLPFLIPRHLPRIHPFFSCVKAGAEILVLVNTKQGANEGLSQGIVVLCLTPSSFRLTTPINPALKPDRLGIGKKTSSSSECS
jgi:hypothetical protein